MQQNLRAFLATLVVISLTLAMVPFSTSARLVQKKSGLHFGTPTLGLAQTEDQIKKTEFPIPNFSDLNQNREPNQDIVFFEPEVTMLLDEKDQLLTVDPQQSGPPTVTRPIVTSQDQSQITFEFDVYTNGSPFADVVSQWLNKNTTKTEQSNPNRIFVASHFKQPLGLTNVSPGVPYAFRAGAQNASNQQTFTDPVDFMLGGTTGANPIVLTGEATAITTSSFQINGTITPNGSVRGGSRVRRQGTTTWLYSSPSDHPNGGIGVGNAPLPFSNEVTDASPATWYEFEVLAVRVESPLGQAITENNILGVGGVKTVKTEGNAATLTVTASRNLIQVGETVTMSATSAGQDVSRLTRFTSSDPTILSASGDLLFTGMREGAATITGTYNGLSSSFSVTVRGVPPPDWTITIAPQFSGNEVTPITLSVSVTGTGAITSYKWQGFGQEVETSVPTLTLTLPAAMNPYSLTVVATHTGGQSKTVTSSIKVVDVVSITKARFDGTSLLVKATTSSAARLTTMGVSWPGGGGILVKRGKKGLFVGSFSTDNSPTVITVTSPFGGVATLQKG